MNFKKIALIALIILVLSGAGLYYVLSSAGTSTGTAPKPLNQQYNLSVIDTGVVDYGAEGQRSVYITYSAATQDLRNITLHARRYASEIPTDIYMLDYPSDGSTGKDDFKQALESGLMANGVLQGNATLQVVKINQPALVSKRMVLIVPTGRIPADLVDPSSDVNIAKLAARGCVIIYLGGDFSLSIGRDSVVREIPDGTLSQFNLSYGARLGPGTDRPYRLEQSRFTFTGPGSYTVSNAITVQPIGSGYVAAFPDTLDLGWGRTGPAAAGEDIAEFIYQAGWQVPITAGTLNVPVTNATNPFRGTLFLNPSPDNGGFVRLYITAISPNETNRKANVTFKREFRDLVILNPVTGTISHPAIGVNGSTLNFHIVFRENFSETREINLYLRAFKNMEEVQEQDLGAVSFETIYERNMRYNVNLSGGDHVLRVQDFSGKTYAQSFLHIPDVTILSKGEGWEVPRFAFQMLSDGLPVANTVVTVKMDGKFAKNLTTSSDGSFSYAPPEVPAFGDHTFTFEATGRTMALKLSRVRTITFVDDPKNQIILVAIVIVGILGIALQRTEPPKYYIDVPDFPPQKKERIPLSRFSLINLIESTNKDYRWKYMPLTAQEIKANVRKKLTYQGKAIMISDYNLEKLLGQLCDTGEIFLSSGLYGLKGWIAQSGKAPDYLATFRTLRNFFINSAVLFTDIGQRQDCDTLANYRGENLMVHIYEGDATVRRALLSARKGRNYIVFSTAYDVAEFLRRLSNSATPASVALKMEMDSGQVVLTHAGALGRILGRAS